MNNPNEINCVLRISTYSAVCACGSGQSEYIISIMDSQMQCGVNWVLNLFWIRADQ